MQLLVINVHMTVVRFSLSSKKELIHRTYYPPVAVFVIDNMQSISRSVQTVCNSRIDAKIRLLQAVADPASKVRGGRFW